MVSYLILILLVILFYHAFFIVITDLYFLILAVIAQIFNPIAELIIFIGIPIKEAKAEIEIHLVIIEFKITRCCM